jgi:hypothetical protein
VDGRVLEDQRAGRHLHLGLDQLEDAAATGDERLVVDEAALDLGVPAHGVEVVLLVVIERRLLTEATKHRIRIGVDAHVVRVVVQVGHPRSSRIWDGPSGGPVIVTPKGEMASATALTTAGGAPMAPPSPTPL